MRSDNFQVIVSTDQPLCQQELRACRPSLTSYPTTFAIAFSLVHVLLAVFIACISFGWQEIRIRYDNVCESGQKCTLEFNTSFTLNPPVYIYYELDGFIQNHYRFRQSIDYKQLSGQYVTDGAKCEPKVNFNNSSTIMAPCGLRAYYTWTDVYTMPDSWDAVTKNITWEHEIGNLYRELSDKYTDSQRWMKSIPEYEDEVMSDKFAIWMRTSPRPHFKKLYARLNGPVKAGSHKIDVDLNFGKDIYSGKRYIVMNTLSKAGGRNLTLIGVNIFIGFVYVIGALISSIATYRSSHSNDSSVRKLSF